MILRTALFAKRGKLSVMDHVLISTPIYLTAAHAEAAARLGAIVSKDSVTMSPHEA